MSGHSKWAKIKRAKGATDAKRGALFTKLGNMITVAARSGGGDPSMNFVLRLAMDKAKEANMPKDNMQKAVDRGLGTGKDALVFENITYEALYGGDVMLAIDTLTDNKNRTVANVKKAVEGSGGTMGALNTVLWQFEEKGRVNIYLAKIKKSEKYGGVDTLERVASSKDEVMLEILDLSGVNDVVETTFEFNGTDEMKNDGNSEYDGFEVYTDKSNLNTVYKAIEALGFKVESVEVVRIPKSTIAISDETRLGKFENLLSNIDELDDVQNVWTNVEGY
jgi:YebC/PmpR family DNA-binding regulatory protein